MAERHNEELDDVLSDAMRDFGSSSPHAYMSALVSYLLQVAPLDSVREALSYAREEGRR